MISSTKTWLECVDVIVIGSGLAGLAAAIEAGRTGALVAVLEKMKGFGGNSVISDGAMAAAGTSRQRRAGIDDSPGNMALDMIKAGLGLNHPALVRRLTENSAETLEWATRDLGVSFMDRIDQFGGHSVPRSYTTHNRSGSALVRKEMDQIRSLGVKYQTRMYLERILRDDTGRVTGALVRRNYHFPDAQSGEPIRIKARKALVLASGGYANDIPFRSAQDPRLDGNVDSTNRVCTTGEGLRAALRIGASPVQLSQIQLGPWTSPDEKMYGLGPDFSAYVAFPYGVIIHPDTGLRVVNELADRKIRADAILRIGQPCIAVADARVAAVSGYRFDRALEKGVVKTFPNLDDLAGFYGLPAEAFRKTISSFNDFVEQGEDLAFGKPILSGACPLTHPPFLAMRVWPKVHHTMGGVMIDDQARVLDLDQAPIPGLYAAGEVTGGVHGACRLGSCAITDCLVFGRLAGQNAIREHGRPSL